MQFWNPKFLWPKVVRSQTCSRLFCGGSDKSLWAYNFIEKEECKIINGIKISMGFFKKLQRLANSTILLKCWGCEFRAHSPLKYIDRVISFLWRIDMSPVSVETNYWANKFLSDNIINSVKFTLSLFIY